MVCVFVRVCVCNLPDNISIRVSCLSLACYIVVLTLAVTCVISGHHCYTWSVARLVYKPCVCLCIVCALSVYCECLCVYCVCIVCVLCVYFVCIVCVLCVYCECVVNVCVYCECLCVLCVYCVCIASVTSQTSDPNLYCVITKGV